MSSTSNVKLREVAAQVVAQRADAAAHAVPHPEDAQT
jgi:hypothetical protein